VNLSEVERQIVEAALEVHKNLGLGFTEPAYKQALAYELELRKIPYERQKKIKVSYKGNVADESTLDMVVDDAVIVEVHAQEPLASADETKMKSFLKATKMGLGVLVDFGRDNLEIRSVNR